MALDVAVLYKRSQLTMKPYKHADFELDFCWSCVGNSYPPANRGGECQVGVPRKVEESRPNTIMHILIFQMGLE